MRTTPDRIESSLDDALDMTFPASDPIAVFTPVVTADPNREARYRVFQSGDAVAPHRRVPWNIRGPSDTDKQSA